MFRSLLMPSFCSYSFTHTHLVFAQPSRLFGMLDATAEILNLVTVEKVHQVFARGLSVIHDALLVCGSNFSPDHFHDVLSVPVSGVANRLGDSGARIRECAASFLQSLDDIQVTFIILISPHF